LHFICHAFGETGRRKLGRGDDREQPILRQKLGSKPLLRFTPCFVGHYDSTSAGFEDVHRRVVASL
jgi:hypothetical protein